MEYRHDGMETLVTCRRMTGEGRDTGQWRKLCVPSLTGQWRKLTASLPQSRGEAGCRVDDVGPYLSGIADVFQSFKPTGRADGVGDRCLPVQGERRELGCFGRSRDCKQQKRSPEEADHALEPIQSFQLSETNLFNMLEA